MDKSKFGLYITLSQIIIGILAFGYLMYIGRQIIMPLVFALLLSILINPVVLFLTQKKVPRFLAISLSVGFTFLIVTAVIYFIASQLGNFMDALPELQKKFDVMVADGVKWLSETFHVSARKANDWISKIRKENLEGGVILGRTVTTITGALVYVFLLPVYMFLFLYYKPLLLEFAAEIFPEQNHGTLAEILIESKRMIQSYLVGLCFEAIIVAVLNSTALLVIGLQYAILIGIIGALLNVIPYLGGVISTALPMVLALVTRDPSTALWVLAAFVFVQLIDNNIIVPLIVASKVRVNALAAIIVVLIGGALWGIPGMFLSLPITAICKVILDRIDAMKPFGLLIGDTMPANELNLFRLVKRKKKTSA